MGGDRPTIPEVIDLFTLYRSLPGNAVWGTLHVVLEDGNVDNGSVEFSIKWAHEEGDVLGGALARILLDMTRTQRSRLGRLIGYPPYKAEEPQ